MGFEVPLLLAPIVAQIAFPHFLTSVLAEMFFQIMSVRKRHVAISAFLGFLTCMQFQHVLFQVTSASTCRITILTLVPKRQTKHSMG